MAEQTEQTEMTVTTNHNIPNFKESWDKKRLLRLIVHISNKCLSDIVTHQGKSLTNKDFLSNLITLHNSLKKDKIDNSYHVSPCGRLQPDNFSYLNIHHESSGKFYRSFLLNGIAYDVDMSSSKPYQVFQECKKLNIPCPHLEKFIQHKDEMIQTLGGNTRNVKDFFNWTLDCFSEEKAKKLFQPQHAELVKTIRQELININKKIKKHHKVDTLTEWYYTMETKIMLAVLKYCKERQIEVIGLIYDGFLPTSPIDCSTLNNYILNEVGVHTKFNIKPWRPHEKITGSTKIRLQGVGKKIPDDFLPTLDVVRQKRLFFIPHDGNFYLTEKAKIKKIGNCIINQKHAELIMTSWGSSLTSFLKSDPPQIDQVILDPKLKTGVNPSNEGWHTLNMWNGMDVTPNDKGYEKTTIKPFLDHIKLVWSQNDERRYKYNLQWLAHKLQKPHKRIGVAVVLRGGQGSGKSQICEIITKIIGSHHSATMNSFDEICGNFNPKMSGNIFITLEEAVWGGSKKEASRLKDIIKGKDITVNNKFALPREERNYADFIINSNNEHVVSLEKDDRRYFVQDTDNTYCAHGGVKTFEECREYHANVRNVPIQQICNYLHQFDISDFVSEDFPKTDACKELTLLSDDFLEFIDHLETEKHENWGIKRTDCPADLIGECSDFYHLWVSLGFHQNLNRVHFGKKMKKHYGSRLVRNRNLPTTYTISGVQPLSDDSDDVPNNILGIDDGVE